MATIIYDNETTFDALKDKTIAIMGYGSQGHAHALNLHESGLNVIVGLRKGSSSWAKAEGDGLKVMTVAEAAKAANVIMVLLPDEKQASVYYSEIEPNLKAGMRLLLRTASISTITRLSLQKTLMSSCRSQGSWSHRKKNLYRRYWCAGPDCNLPGRNRKCQGNCSFLCQGNRCNKGRRL